MFATVTMKLGDMKRAVQWTIAPAKDGKVMVQGNSRIAEIDLTAGKGRLSANQKNGAYFHHLNFFLGATEIDVPADTIEAIRTAIGDRKDYAQGHVVLGI